MPELPEVETVCRTLRRHVLGRSIQDIEVLQPRLRWPVDVPLLKKLTRDRTIVAVRRRAKYLLLDLQLSAGAPNGAVRTVLAVHLGMSGILRVAHQDLPLRLHDHVVIRFAQGDHDVRFNDPRRFGSVHSFLLKNEAAHPLLVHLGVEPLDGEAFTGAYLHRCTQNSERTIKQVVMDGRVVVGVGNIYASEALHRCGISPRTMARRLSKARVSALAAAIVDTLTDAIDQGGTTLRDFTDANANQGHFARRLLVYGRESEACRRCGCGIKRIIQNGRSTYYCSGCQRA